MSIGWRVAVSLVAVLVAAPAWAGDFTAGPLDPAPSLVAASHSTVAPVSPTVEQFNDTPARIEDAEAKDASISAALTVNDVFGVAEGHADEPIASVDAELAYAEDPAGLRRDVSGALTIANGLALPTARQMMAPPGELAQSADTGGQGGPIALNAAAE